MTRGDKVVLAFVAVLAILAAVGFVWYTLTPMALSPTDMPYPAR